jgi:hypothetical protein
LVGEDREIEVTLKLLLLAAPVAVVRQHQVQPIIQEPPEQQIKDTQVLMAQMGAVIRAVVAVEPVAPVLAVMVDKVFGHQLQVQMCGSVAVAALGQM